MVNIPMTAKKPMRSSELGQLNRTGRPQTLQTLLQNRPAAEQRPAPSQQRQSTPPPAPSNRRQSGPAPGQRRSTPPPPPRHPHPPVSGQMLQKGQKISLSQLDPGLNLVEVGMGWDLGPNSGGYDLDVEAFLLGPSGKVPGDDWFVFYNQPASPDGAVRLLESGPSGGAPWDDRVMQVRLSQVDPRVSRIAFIVTINEALDHGYNFSGVSNAYVRLVNKSARRELVRFQLTDYYSSVCSMVVGELYRYKDEWRFSPVGNGTGDDLAGLCRRYGVTV